MRLLIVCVLTACSGTVADAPSVEDAAIAEDVSADSSSSVDTSTDTLVEPIDSFVADTAPIPDVVAPDVAPACPPTLKPGGEYKIVVDAFTGNEATTMPKTDANDGKAGDNPAFRRTNVARAHTFGEPYWFTSKHQEAGEPNPKGDQWVDYVPPFAKIGGGRYRVLIKYRAGENRATYPAKYIVQHASGPTTVTRDQHIGTDITEFDVGTYAFGCSGSVRVEDAGAESISFAGARFVYVGP
jgi:hypothetical protein